MEYGVFDERLGRSPEKIWLLPLEEREKRIKEIFKKKKGYELNLDDPQTYNEKIQWYKLYYRNPLLTQCVDKVEAKKFIAKRIGEGYTAKLLKVWQSPDDVSFDGLPNKCIIKSNCQDNGRYINILNNMKKNELEELKEEIKKYWFNPLNLLINGFCSAYHNVIPKVFAEEYIEEFASENFMEYKVICFDGKPEFCYIRAVHVGENNKPNLSEVNRASFYSLDEWKRIDVMYGTYPKAFLPYYNAPKPYHHDEMLAVAKTLSTGFPYVRVDFMDTANKLYVGELTFYHGGGYNIFEPEDFDRYIGSFFQLPKKQK